MKSKKFLRIALIISILIILALIFGYTFWNRNFVQKEIDNLDLASIRSDQKLDEYFVENNLDIYEGALSIINQIEEVDPIELVLQENWSLAQLGEFVDLVVWVDNYGDDQKELSSIREYVQKNIYREDSEATSFGDFWNLTTFAEDLCDTDPTNFYRYSDGSCYQKISFDLEGTPPMSNRIMINNEYEGDRVELSLAIQKSAGESNQKFRSIGYEQKPITFWINTEATSTPSEEGFETWMDAAYYRDEDACTINIYPFATEALNPYELTSFRQTIAHEMFHCIQGIYYPEQESVSWPLADWWGEGSAEFFSDWVYPTFDNEDGFNYDLDNKSQDNSVLKMSYENYVLFQSINNQLGIEGVKNFLDQVSTSSNISDHLLKLSKYPGIDKIFEKTIQNYIANQHKDTSGALKDFNPPYDVNSVHTITDIGEANFESNSFEYGRGQLTIRPASYDREVELEDVAGSGRLMFYDRDKEVWKDEPVLTKIESCSSETDLLENNYLVSVLNTDGSNQKYEGKVNVITEEEIEDLPIDENLVGVWKDDVESLQSFLNKISEKLQTEAASLGYDTDFKVIDKYGYGCFFWDNTFIYNGLTTLEFSGSGPVDGSLQSGTATFTSRIRIQGKYSAENGQLTLHEKEELTEGKYTVSVPGFGINQNFPIEPETNLILEPETVPYLIEGDQLKTSISTYGQTHDFVLNKVR